MTTDISHLLAPATPPMAPGVHHQSMLAFLRAQDTSVSEDLKNRFLAWVEDKRGKGEPIDQEIVDRVVHDFNVHNRLSPETQINAPHAPYVSLDHKQDHHFGNA